MSKRIFITLDNESIIILKKLKKLTKDPKWFSDFVNIELKRHFELSKEDELEVIKLEIAKLNLKIIDLDKDKESILNEINKLAERAKKVRNEQKK